MDLTQLRQMLGKIEADAAAVVAEAKTVDALRSAESKITKGALAEALKAIKSFPTNERGSAGQAVNKAKAAVAGKFAAAIEGLRAAGVAGERKAAGEFDPTLPPERTPRGALHPVTIVQREVERIFTGLGFAVVGGPEMETEYYNFEALNIPAMHPARDAQDTFWLNAGPGEGACDSDGGERGRTRREDQPGARHGGSSTGASGSDGWLLRTHTSPCQVRAMLKYGPPIRVIAPGRCFRYEAIDASHENTFYQLEGLLIDKDISIAHLIAFMKLLLREVFHRDVRVRLRPGFFPFVEPGFELDMSCAICDGKGCATCKRSGWVEILPCGMVHPNVLRHGNIDPHEYTGFAFGLGLTRLAMMKYGVADIRILNSGDLRGIVSPTRLGGAGIGP